MVCASLAEPWSIEDSINRALQLVEDHVKQMYEMEATELEKLQESCEYNLFLHYLK